MLPIEFKNRWGIETLDFLIECVKFARIYNVARYESLRSAIRKHGLSHHFADMPK